MKASSRFSFFLSVLTILWFSGLAVAQDAQDQDPPSDPPSRVVRLQYVQGQVSLQPGGVDDWVEANMNRPLTTADRIWTDRDARAELTMASAALRMGSETSVTITNLDDNTAQIELDQGTLNLSVRYLNPGEIVEVDTPNFAYTVTQPGEYRFDVMPDEDQSWIVVRRGDGAATGQGNAVRVRSGQRVSFTGGQSLDYTSSGLPRPDGFDDWCEIREQRETSSPSARYVAAGTIGYEDLDGNGDWQPSPVYGSIWFPRVHPGWAPYREGHWAWVEPWGWTWVDDAPWGFAPFHYGRWVDVGDRWGWVPGPTGVRPVYAPALVAWVGGPGFAVGIGGGGVGVGWFPLGWRDPYLPSYRVSPMYARNVNISNSRVVNVTVVNNYYTTNNVNIRNTTINNIHYENARVNGAVTGVPQGAFASGRPIGRDAVVPAGAMGRANFMSNAAVVPTKQAVLGGHAPMQVPQHLAAPRQVVSKTAPPPRPVSFDQQRPLLEKSNGVPLSAQARSNLRGSGPAPASTGGRAPVGQPFNQQAGRPPVQNQQLGGAQTFGRPAGTQTPATNQPNTFGRPATTPANQPAANVNQGNAPARNVPMPPQAGRTNEPVGGNTDARRTPAGANSVPAHVSDTSRTTPASGKPVTPARPANTPPVTQRTSPASTAETAPRHNAPPPKETKDKEKEKDSKER
jgi:hypothetical protein